MLRAFADVRTQLTANISGPQLVGLTTRLGAAQTLYLCFLPPNPIHPPSPISPVAGIIISIDSEVQALRCSGAVTFAGASAVRTSVVALLARLNVGNPLFPNDPVRC